MLSDMLKRKGVPHNVLNAKQHEREAGVIAQAGRPGTVTIATNMAGRGVDILLGGNADGMARERLRKEGVDLATLSEDDPVWRQALEQAKREVEADRQTVIDAGGLHVLGTERHEARRIDNQLRGRAGRQGDPGSSRFYVSLDDDLMRRFGGQNVANIMERFGMDEDVPIEHSIVSKAIENAQVRVEGYNFDIRKHVLEYDDVVNKQREVIYNQRRQILNEPTMRPTIQGMVEDELRKLVTLITTDQESGRAIPLERSEWDLDTLAGEVNKIVPLPETFDPEVWRSFTANQLGDELVAMAEAAYDEREQEMGEENMRRLERLVMLRIVDNRWIRHLTDLDELREGIGLRAFAQQDPLVAYKREASQMYGELMESIAHDIAYSVFHVQLMTRPPAPPVRQIQTNRSDGGSQPARASSKGQIGRNDPCWCGSGKKYKQCHMREDQGRAPATVAAGAGSGGSNGPQPAHQGAPQSGTRAAAKPSGAKQPAKSGKRR